MTHELMAPFVEARALLGAALDASAGEIKRAYRAAVAQHPPDREPELFGRIRAAYELLSEPLEPARERLISAAPLVPPPTLPAPPRPGDVLLLALRHQVGRVPTAVVLAAATSFEKPPRARKQKLPVPPSDP